MNETAARFLLGDRAYLLTGAMDDWDLKRWDFNHLVDNFGESMVDYYPHNMREETVKPFFSNVRDALAQFTNPTGIFQVSEIVFLCFLLLLLLLFCQKHSPTLQKCA